jgi:hypothetical protein
MGNTTGSNVEEKQTVTKLEQNTLQNIVSNEIFDYANQAVDAIDGVNSDGVYGEY